MKYRDDIEGLRGLAVTLVVLGHAGIPGFAGGYVGVDVFFVISGFLITGILVEELNDSASIDFFTFYARRIRRLMPAFAVMILAVIGACSLLLPAGDWLAQAEPLAWASVWSSNLYFAFANIEYFGAEARDSAVLHTWSLGVEEQFYLIWPLLLLLWWRWFRGDRSRLRSLLLALTVLGFLASLLATAYVPIQAYYLMPCRLWELALGGSGVFFIGCFEKRINSRGASVLGGLGLLAIVASALAFDNNITYPGIYAMMPTLGSFAVLLIGASAPTVSVSRALASPGMTFLGRISYSWYLWHWPVLVLGGAIGTNSFQERLVLVAVSIALAAASYSCVEQPARRISAGDGRRLVATGLTVIAVLTIVSQSWKRITPLQLISRPTTFADKVHMMVQMPAIYHFPHCDDYFKSAEVVPCRASASNPTKKVAVLFGDSVAVQWYPGLVAALKESDMEVVVLTKSSCPMVDKTVFLSRINRDYVECGSWRSAAIDYINRMQPAIVILGSAGNYGFSTRDWRDGTRRVLSRIGSSQTRVYVLAPTPTLPFNGPACLISKGMSKTTNELDQICTVPLAAVENVAAIDALRDAASAEGARTLYMNDLVCPAGVCHVWLNGELVYRDRQHLNGVFAAELASAILRRMVSSSSFPVSAQIDRKARN